MICLDDLVRVRVGALWRALEQSRVQGVIMDEIGTVLVEVTPDNRQAMPGRFHCWLRDLQGETFPS